MRHRKHTFKVGRNASHRRCMMANMLKALIEKGRIQTTLTKAKELRRHADKMITLAKQNDLPSRRLAVSKLMISYNPLTSKEARTLKQDGLDQEVANTDRRVLKHLFDTLGVRFASRQGGYTRIIKTGIRVGDNSDCCIIEYLPE